MNGFYKGLLPALLRVTPACCITFVVYENLISYFLHSDQTTLKSPKVTVKKDSVDNIEGEMEAENAMD